ncbi:MAG: molybdopterin-dependent oxidoreductase [Chloroflexi bacterium]|nr:molybdopterin-dependent oxidoreductase [Chloroflexota bacterium]
MKENGVTLVVNGRQVSADAGHCDWTLARYLREVLGLTGTKQSCDNEGTCGSCTVIIDGRPRRACLEQVRKLDGARIETIETLGMDGGKPHPLLQTVVQDGIFQCGYCAPGALMAAKALLDREPDPSRESILRAISPVICRCAGLNRMDRSVARAAAILRGQLETTWTDEDTANESDLLARLTGQLRYTDDLAFPGMLYGQALRSPLPHAKVLKVDKREAEKMPGVVRVLTAEDVPGKNRYGLLTRDTPIFNDDQVRWVGDCLALVVAETPEAAAAATARIHVELDPLHVITSPQKALEPGAPVLHEYLRAKFPETPNVLEHHQIRKGDVEKGFAQADVVIEDDYHVPFIDHAFMEIECSIGVPEPGGRVTVYCGSQGPIDDRAQVAEALGIDKSQVRIAHQYVGGGFGGKEDVAAQVQAAVAARVTGRPVKIRWSRAESLRVHHKRHAMDMHYKMGATKDGRLVAAQVRVLGDTGAYASTGEAVLFRSCTFACGPYVVPNAEVDTYAVLTNNPICGAFRGFGGTQVAFASEVHVQKLIDALGADPWEFRMKNALDLGQATITGQVLTEDVGAGIKACFEALKKQVDVTPRPAVRPDEKLGIGIAGAYKNVGLGSGIPDQSGARVSLEPDGKFLVRHGAPDIGQGANDVAALVAGRTLGVPRKYIRVHNGDTDLDPFGGMTTASRATFLTGNAVLQASQELRQRLWNAVGGEFGAAADEIELREGLFVDKRTGRVLISLAELGRGDEHFVAETMYAAPETNRMHSHVEAFPTPGPGGHRTHFAHCYGAQAAYVAVNPETGAVRVLKVIAAHDAGLEISHNNCIGQIEGAVVQGIGYALSEDYAMVDGIPQVTKFRDLGLLRQSQVPEIVPILVQEPHPKGPYGAKGLGELALSPAAPAIVNAIHDAVGVWVNELPAGQDRVLAALQEKKNKEKGNGTSR